MSGQNRSGGGGGRPPRGGSRPGGGGGYKPREGGPSAGGGYKPRDAAGPSTGYKPREAGGGDKPRDGARGAGGRSSTGYVPRAATGAPSPGRDGKPREGRPPREDRFRDAAPIGEPIQGDGERVIYGANPIREVLAKNPRSIRSIWVDRQRAEKTSNDPVALIVTAARAAGIKVDDRERTILDRATDDGTHQGVIAWLGAFTYAQLEDVLPTDEPAMLVMLDGVEDPRNLGAVLRSAYLLGAHAVIIPEHRAAQVTSLVSKTSAGASELIPIVQVGNLVRTLEQLRELNIWRIAVHATPDAQPIAKLDGKMPLVLVLGGEGDGVRPLVAKNCDFHALIPMQRAGIGSFNVSVAAALALYELRRQRT